MHLEHDRKTAAYYQTLDEVQETLVLENIQ